MPLHSRMMRHVRRPRRTRKVKCWAGVAGKLGLVASALDVKSDGCLATVGIANPEVFRSPAGDFTPFDRIARKLSGA